MNTILPTGTTRERVLARYNSIRRRATIEDPAIRRFVFRSFDNRLARWLPADRDARILDVACGEGALLSYLQSRGYRALEGFDISRENVGICHRLGLPFVAEGDLTRLPHEPASGEYELIFAMDVIEHIPKDDAASVLEALRLRLKSGGSLVIQMPNMGYLLAQFHRYGDLTHEFGVNENSVVDLLTAAGFSAANIEVLANWEATTIKGQLRDAYVSLIHRLVFLMDGAARPRIPTKNLLVRARA